MPWVKLDDDFFDHIKVVRVGRDARDLYLAALLYSSKSLSDGNVPSDILDYLAGKAGVSNPAELAHRLVDVNLWEEAECGWLIHDYHEYNPAAERVIADRNAARERMAKVRENGHAQKPDVPPMYRSRSGEVHANNGRTTDEVPPTPYPVPVPDRSPENSVSSHEETAALTRPPVLPKSFATYTEALRGAPANKAAAVLAEAIEVTYGVECKQFGRLAKLANAHGAGELLRTIFGCVGQWNRVDDPVNFVQATITSRKNGRNGPVVATAQPKPKAMTAAETALEEETRQQSRARDAAEAEALGRPWLAARTPHDVPESLVDG